MVLSCSGNECHANDQLTRGGRWRDVDYAKPIMRTPSGAAAVRSAPASPHGIGLPRPRAGLWLLVGRQAEAETTPLPQYTLTPDHTAQLFDEFFGHRQAVACRE